MSTTLCPLGPPSSSSAFSPDRKADPSVTGVFTFRGAPLSFERRRKGVGVVDAELELGDPKLRKPSFSVGTLEKEYE